MHYTFWRVDACGICRFMRFVRNEMGLVDADIWRLI